MKTSKMRGFTVIEAFLIIVVIAVIGFIGYTVAQNTVFKNETALDNINISETADDVPVAPEIEVDSDLSEVTETLDSINLDDDGGDIDSLESQLSEF